MSDGNGERRRVFLGMPGYGEITAGAARGFYRATSGTLAVRREYQEGSLLASNMNKLWCTALNDLRGGASVDYFAMQHSDIEPEDFWLDALVAEMEANDLDVLGVVAPIKDPRGVTSLALARDDGDTWGVHARLTMAEVYRLPETFTSEDVGRPLLLNTGLWVCRFREEWARQVSFTINDRICFDPKRDRYFSQVESEDWYFSRLLHEMGKRLGCTRKVKLRHRGPALFENGRAWGREQYDTAHVSESVLPAVGRDGFRFPRDVAGWLSFDEGRALFDLAAGKDVLEIGSYCGRSTICLAQKAKSVSAVDPFDGRATPRPGETLAAFLANTQRYGVNDRVEMLVGTSAEVLPGLSEPCYDLVLIDGAHDRESVETDIRLASQLLRPGGLLAFHDYRTQPGEHDGGWDVGVNEAVNALLGAGGELVSRHGTLAVVRPPAHALSEV